jgi:predicted lipoprotein
MHRALIIAGALVAAGVLTWFFPLFHVVSRSSLKSAQAAAEFQAADYVKNFWAERLTPALSEADDAVAVLTALRENPEQARTEFGRTVGLGRSTLYFISGKGTIVAVDGKSAGVSLGSASKEPEVSISTGLLFGNTARDATGLLNGSEFPNSQQFNEISTELNRTIEASVLPKIKNEAQVGNTIQFVGCAEVTTLPRDISPLKIVPLQVSIGKSP